MIYLFTIAVCLVTGIIFKNTKVIGFWGLMVLAYLTGTANPLTTLDYEDYLIHYNIQGLEVSPFEKGYTLVSSFFLMHGFDYAHFRIIIAYVAFIFMFIGVCHFTNNVALFTGIYGISFFFLDAIQIRNLLMLAMLILGVGLLAEKNKKSKIFGIFLMFVSTQFHDLGYLFLLFFLICIFTDRERIEKYFNLYVGISFGLGVILLVFNSKTSIVNILYNFLLKFSSRSASAENIMSKYGRGNGISTVIIIWISLLLLYISLKFIINDLKQLGIYNDDHMKILLVGCMVAFTVAFLAVLAPDYLRLDRVALCFYIILLCVLKGYLGTIRKVNPKKIGIILCLLLISIYINNKVWGSEYLQSIPFLIGIEK